MKNNKNSIFHLSFSKLKTYEDCRIRFYFDYVYKIKIFEQNYYSVLGILTHFFIERMIQLDANYKQIYSMYSNIDKLIEDLYLKNFNDEQIISYSEAESPIEEINTEVTKKVNEIVSVLFKYDKIPLYEAFKFTKQSEQYIQELKTTYKEIFPEIELLYQTKLNKKIDIVYQGIIDIVALNPESNNVKIVDIKTSKTNKFLHNNQLLFYGYLYERINDINKESLPYSLEFFNVRNLEIKRYKFTSELLNKFEKYISDYAKRIYVFSERYKLNFTDTNEIRDAIMKNKKYELKNDVKDKLDEIIEKNFKHISLIDKNTTCKFCKFKNICPIY